MFRLLLASLATLLLAACAQVPQRTATGAQWVPSVNFDDRKANYIVIHQTSDHTAQEALDTLTDPRRKVSAHYLIGRDGALYQLVAEDQRAWHAGLSYWGGQTDLNSASIGIELDNDGEEPFADAQIAALLPLLEGLVQRHAIPRSNVIGHGDIAPGRKVDPSRYFPWARLAARGFGRWCFAPATMEFPPVDPLLGLRALGYDVSRPEAAISAFRRHFLGDDNFELGPDGQRTLACLLQP